MASSGSRPSEASKSSAEAPAVHRNGRECRVKAISVRQATKMMSLWPALVNTLAVLATVAVVSTGGTRWAPAAFLVPLVIILWRQRSAEHTSELQSRGHLVCRLLLEKRKQ